jgi:LemA protein
VPDLAGRTGHRYRGRAAGEFRGQASTKGTTVIVLWIVLGILALVLIAGIVSYNRFISQRNLIRDAWANIDTELRRRYDLIPNLVESVRGYATHEREVFENVTAARAAAVNAQGPAAQAQAENVLTAALGRLFAVAEAYPQLRASENFMALQNELSNTEDRIQTSRRFYNGNVRDYNTRVKAFPSNVIAGMFNFEEEEYFEIDEAIREAGPPQVNFNEPPAVSTTPPPAIPPPATPPAVPPAPPAEPPTG